MAARAFDKAVWIRRALSGISPLHCPARGMGGSDDLVTDIVIFGGQCQAVQRTEHHGGPDLRNVDAKPARHSRGRLPQVRDDEVQREQLAALSQVRHVAAGIPSNAPPHRIPRRDETFSSIDLKTSAEGSRDTGSPPVVRQRQEAHRHEGQLSALSGTCAGESERREMTE
ncbi:hypothetical protein ABZ250_34200 [Streptomyces afghaniensis]|uniref:hypothetical protein n=1 Tax=Streptomyces afghaniensis TaxID=66865 RepID=UPI0033ADBE1E